MKYATIITFLLTLTLQQKHQENQPNTDLTQLKWLIGTWERTNVKPGTTAFEVWKTDTENSLIGRGISLKGADTTFVENLKIEIKDEKLYYVAEVSHNAAPTYFEITEISANAFTAQNPTHDFPKVIAYELKDNELTATISDGKTKGMQFIFNKIYP